MADETRNDPNNVGSPPTSILPELENSGNGNTVAFEKDDLKYPVRKTLGDYLSYLTRKNDFPIKEGSVSFKVHEEDGTPKPISVQDTNAKRTYLGTFEENNPNSKVKAEFQKYSNSGYLDTQTPFVIKKGKSNLPLKSGEDLLKDVDANLDNSEFVGRVQEVIKDHNRHNSAHPFIPRRGLADDTINNSVTEDDSNIGIGIVQKEFGVHYPRKSIDAASKAGVSAEPSTAILKIKELKKLGFISMLRASGEVIQTTDPTNAAQELAARGATLVPGLARVGQRVPTSRFSPRQILKDIDPDFAKTDLNNNLETKEVYSYGNVNNYLVPFAGLSSASTAVGAGILATAVAAMLKGVAVAVTRIKDARSASRTLSTQVDIFSANSNQTLEQKRKKRLGSFLEKSKVLDIETAATYHDYFKCVDRGINIFFGLEGGPLQAPGNSVNQIAASNGFYNTVLRNIVRSITDDFVNSFGLSIGTIAPSANFSTIGRGFAKEEAGIAGIPIDPIALVKKLNSSQLLKFVNILASIGDTALLLDKQGYDTNNIAGFDITEVSDIDKIEELLNRGESSELNLGVLQSKDRLSSRLGTLAWNSHTVPSMYWFPQSILSGANVFYGSNDNGVLKAKGSINDIVKSTGQSENRISAADVKALEDKLEADYMPFYFHDLRTNEIISFHAFLEDVSDAYNADYEESEGYGRSGKVLTYKNTNRSIGLSFKVVATNPEDFDQMWWKINKLTTLLYPQYSEGRRLSDSNNNKFIQPFSQLQTSSPLIRLRLGDLFKSNYSRFALARLFGVTSNHFQIGQSTSGRTTFEQQIQIERRVASVKERMLGRKAGVARFNQGEFAYLKPNGQPGVLGTANAYPKEGNISFTVNPADLVGALGNQRGLVVHYSTRVSITGILNGGQSFKVRVDNAQPGQDGTYIVPSEALLADPTEFTRLANNSTPVGNQSLDTNTSTPVRDFFAEDGARGGNAVFKSFASTQGKGLAGFIKSINFDLNETTWETERYNARAPMFVKISMEFQPVHDINPGIDYNGFNNAPLYNVGNILKSFNKEESSNNRTDPEANFNKSRAALSKVRGPR